MIAARDDSALRDPVPTAQSQGWLVWVALVLVLGVGAGLRFWNITAGLPYRLAADEPVTVERALHILRTGDFNPHFFDYPGLYIYIQTALGFVRFVTGTMGGMFRTVDEFHAEHLIPWTRSLSALLGTSTLFLLYGIGRRWSPAVGLASAALLAFWPNHVRESHFALTDIPLTFFTTLAVFLSLKSVETRKLRWFAAAGFTVGLAAATKYNGGVALLAPLVAAACLEGPVARRTGAAITVMASTGVAFLLGAPYTFLDLPGFLNGFGHLADAYGPQPFSSGGLSYYWYLRTAAGWPAIAVAILGLVWTGVGAILGRQFAKWAIAFLFPLTYFHVIATKQLMFGRYLMPVLPFVCLSMAIVFVQTTGWLWSLGPALNRPQLRWVPVGAAAALILAICFPLARNGVTWTHEYGRRTTQDLAYRMIREFIPEGAGVVVEDASLSLPDSVYRVRLVRMFTDSPVQEYLKADLTYLVASSIAFGPVLAQADPQSDVYHTYRTLLNDTSRCLPAIKPTEAIQGPEIRLCRLQPAQ